MSNFQVKEIKFVGGKKDVSENFGDYNGILKFMFNLCHLKSVSIF